ELYKLQNFRAAMLAELDTLGHLALLLSGLVTALYRTPLLDRRQLRRVSRRWYATRRILLCPLQVTR
ncbi:MAG: hypothetical protein ACN6PW_24185, partial [Pseudomonas kermanshahensis]|uniref:hypothetical protein n=1 Tax=Pseudomonas kermanshahensis TaxID=2745482 RepID=UPI003D1493E6